MLRRDAQGNRSGGQPSGFKLLGFWFFRAQHHRLRRTWSGLVA